MRIIQPDALICTEKRFILTMNLPVMPHARLRTLLAIGYALFIAYASLSPFSGWREQGIAFQAVLHLPLTLTYNLFDVVVNFLSYIPLGLLVGLTLRGSVWQRVLLATLLGCALSAGMEYLQMYLPRRNSSNLDILTNTTGMWSGAMLAVSITAWTSWFAQLTAYRNNLFNQGKEMDFGLALLVLWIFGQINPTLPMLGNLFINEVARQPFVATVSTPFNSGESITVILNLLMVGTLLITLLRLPRHIANTLFAILAGVAAVKFTIASILLKSSALLLWVNSEAVLGIAVGMMLLLISVHLPRKVLIYGGMSITLGYLISINIDLADNSPALGTKIYQWRQGHLRNYNGLAQIISQIFPALLLFHLWRVRRIAIKSAILNSKN